MKQKREPLKILTSLQNKKPHFAFTQTPTEKNESERSGSCESSSKSSPTHSEISYDKHSNHDDDDEKKLLEAELKLNQNAKVKRGMSDNKL